MEKNKQWKNEMLMETLRSKSTKTFLELAKNTRLSLLERRYNIDAVEKQCLQNALDNLQNNIQIKNRGHLVEKLESITRRSLLKFTDNANTNSLFISSDMFYLEILLDAQTGKVNDVKVHHECSNESSEPSLVDVLRRGDFIDFTQQLEGFQSIYQLNAESKIKSKAFISIQALESDLMSIFNFENQQKNSPEMLVLTSSIGLLTKRSGGHPCQLLFFIRPSELLNIEQKRMDSLTNALSEATFAKKGIGNSVTINLEAAAPSNKLQIAPLLVRNAKNDGHSYQQINPNNSAMLPAAFVLRLNQGIPVTLQIIEEIKKITGLSVTGEEPLVPVVKLENSPAITQKDSSSLINLIVNRESAGSYTNGQKGLFVTLVDQSHCYFISDNNPELTATVVKSIQFTEPSHVVKIIKLLRQQALFNALIASCVRKTGTKQDFDCFMFEIQCVSMQFIQIFVEHPIKETIVTVELDLSDVKQVSCRINGSDQQLDVKLENYILRVFQKTMSIPMILRSLIKYWDAESQEFQRIQKRLYHNGIFSAPSESKGASESKKDDKEKEQGDGSSFSGGQQDSCGAFDICGINKNEIFFKTSEHKGEKRGRADFGSSDDIFQRHKMPQVMSFDMDTNADDLTLSERNLIAEDLLNDGPMTPISKVGGSGQKPMDVFEFNDPSPPPTATLAVPLPPPVIEERVKKIPTPRASPSTSSFAMDKRAIDLIPLKNTNSGLDATMNGQTSISITPISSSSKNSYEKPKSEKKKKRKRESNDGEGQSLVKKKSSDSLSGSPSSKKSSSSSQMMGKPPAVSFKPTNQQNLPTGIEPMDDLSFLNFGGDQQSLSSVPSPLPSPQSLLKSSSSAQANRKHGSLSAVINKLKSEMSDAMLTTGGDEKKSEYMIKSSGSDGIKITFNKTKSSKGSKSPKHTGLKPGVNSGPKSSKSSSQKLLYQKSSSSGSLGSSSLSVPSPKSSSQPGKSSSKDKLKDSSGNMFSSFSSNDMLKNMLNLASPAPRSDLIKAFDKKFQIPKLSARKTDEKPSIDDTTSFNAMHPRSAPSTPLPLSTPPPTMDHMREPSGSNQLQMSQQRPPPSNVQQNKFQDQQRNKKLFKSVSSEQLYAGMERHSANNDEINNVDFQAYLKAQSRIKDSSVVKSSSSQQASDSAVNDSDLIDLNFIGNEM